MGNVIPAERRVPRARAVFGANDVDVPPAFVGLSISGGGSRAANFGIAVLEQLDVLGMLQHITALSTTSGGGLAGAYYALKGPSIEWQDARKKMATDFLSKWAWRNVRPDKLITTTFTHEDRSDLMADIFDEELFGGAAFKDLGPLGPRRPIFLANALNVTDGGLFTFTQETFAENQRSYLDSFPLSQAVMASAAFPGVFNSVTVQRFPGAMPPSWARQRPPVPVGYDHLIDGGPADNLGVSSLLRLAVSHQAAVAAKLPKERTQAPCFLFVVDAYPASVQSRKAWRADPRDALDHFIDFNFQDAFDSLLSARRHMLLSQLGLTARASDAGFVGRRLSFDGLPQLELGDATVMADIDVLRRDAYGTTRALTRCKKGECPAGMPTGSPMPPGADAFRCTVWHIGLNELIAIRSFVGEAGAEPNNISNTDEELTHPAVVQRGRMHYVLSQIETNFHLAGPENCSAGKLQEVLYEAAFVTVREDHASRVKACKWFEDSDLQVSADCKRFPGNHSLGLPLRLRSAAPQISQRAGDTSVSCVVD